MAQYFRSIGDQNENNRRFRAVEYLELPGVPLKCPDWRRCEYRPPTSKPPTTSAQLSGYKSISSAADQKCSVLVSSFTPNISPPHMDSNTGVPPLVNSTMWNIWKPQLTFGSDAQWNYDLAYYLYCKLNQM